MIDNLVDEFKQQEGQSSDHICQSFRGEDSKNDIGRHPLHHPACIHHVEHVKDPCPSLNFPRPP